jgi:hypothetical protein
MNEKLAGVRGDGYQRFPGLPGTDPRSDRRDIGESIGRPYERKEVM